MVKKKKEKKKVTDKETKEETVPKKGRVRTAWKIMSSVALGLVGLRGKSEGNVRIAHTGESTDENIVNGDLVYAEPTLVKKIQGDYHKWLNKAYTSESQIGIILGKRGSGKTAFGVQFLENVQAKYHKKCFAMGFSAAELGGTIEIIENITDLENDSFVLIDEGGILFNSRSSMSNANKFLSELILVARHKNLNILFISQNSSNLEINILRQADFLVLKPSSLLQKEFERKIIQKLYDKSSEDFEKFADDPGITYVYSGNFQGFVSNPLPSFWSDKLSKGFK
ncbi:MAG: hypothetical protein ACI83O_000633 [Patescibacteria group bacterium]|jgi:hypothetical protein